MPVYRVFFLDQQNHVVLPAEVVDAADDQEAMTKARLKLSTLSPPYKAETASRPAILPNTNARSTDTAFGAVP